jgi:hypothetical protein
VSFATINLCVASQPVFIVVVVYFVMAQFGNFWINPRTLTKKFVTAAFRKKKGNLQVGSNSHLSLSYF